MTGTVTDRQQARIRRHENRHLARIIHGPHYRVAKACTLVLFILGSALLGTAMIAGIVALWRWIA